LEELTMTMMKRLSTVSIALACLAAASAARAGDAGTVECKLTYSLKGWSAFYKTASGSGTITCNNGQSLAVEIDTKGGGITFGKSEIKNGTGKFSAVSKIDDLLGSYAAAEAHAGAVKSSSARALTKGEVSLALAGTGEGVDIGVDFGKFTISKAGTKKP
jgi:hypothetical protein